MKIRITVMMEFDENEGFDVPKSDFFNGSGDPWIEKAIVEGKRCAFIGHDFGHGSPDVVSIRASDLRVGDEILDSHDCGFITNHIGTVMKVEKVE